jgi:hypothetical protein
MFEEFSTAVPIPRQAPSKTVETRSKSAVFKVSKRDGRAGEIRTRGLLVPNQALYRAKPPPDAVLPEIQTDRRSSAPEASIALTARARWLYRAFSSGLISPNVRPASGTRNTGS